ncbi:MAG TPA: hypothetical protein VGH89_31555 [Pseudonocardia sp.]|jgi:hypothetical protein
MPKGSIETLRTGFRARVYAGKDPISGKQLYVRGETRRDRREAEADADAWSRESSPTGARTSMRPSRCCSIAGWRSSTTS